MKKIIGFIIYLMGILGPAYIITETDIDLGGSFLNILLLAMWILFCFGIGTMFMKSDNN